MSKQKPENRDPFADRLPPHSLSAERSVLGSMILEREASALVIPILQEECFYLPEHRWIFRALINLYEQQKPPDPLVLCEELQRTDVLDRIGGKVYIAELMNAVPSATNVEYYAKIVRDKWMLRELIRANNTILQEAYHQSEQTQEVLDRAEQLIFQITQRRVTGGPEHLKQFLDETWRQLESREGEHYITGLASGFTELDDLTSGFQNGDLIIIAGRPSMGKTALGLNIAEYMAADEKLPVAFFSLEMSKQQVVQRLLCSRAKVDSHKLRRNMLNESDITDLHLACDLLSNAPMFVDDKAGMSVLELRAKSRMMALREKISVVFVDYLQLLTAPGCESRQQEVSSVSRSLKSLARELNVPVIALAQLNRSVEGRESKRPRMSDLRESGSIEQEADVILLLHRQDYYSQIGEETDNDTAGKAELIIAKQRNGPIGNIELQFSKRHTRFNNLAHISDDQDVPMRTYSQQSSNHTPF